MRWISSGSGSKLVLFNKERGVIYFHFFDAEVNRISRLESLTSKLFFGTVETPNKGLWKKGQSPLFDPKLENGK